MTISLKTRKMLWGHSANRCSLPECRRPLVEAESETDDPSIVGEEAHIVARERHGPRGDSDMPIDKRDYYNNLILLCNLHHKIVDDQPLIYTVEKLSAIKEEHVAWVNANLNIDKSKIRDDDVYASYIDEWARMAHIDDWDAWSSFVLGAGQPRIRAVLFDSLKQLNSYLLNRVWPKRYDALEEALKEFRLVLNEFINVLEIHIEDRGDGNDKMLWTRKFYQLDEWNPKLYKDLSDKYEYHVDLIGDLMLELTRAANRICDRVRQTLSASFRIKDGVLVVTSGPHLDFSFKTRRAEYQNDGERFEGLRHFMRARETRNEYFGKGVSEDYFFRL